MDFTVEVERSLRVLDGGVVVFDAVAGVEPQSETVWRQADKYSVPRICFVNKMDRTGASFERTIEMIIDRLKAQTGCRSSCRSALSRVSGVIDLIENVAIIYSRRSRPEHRDATEIPADMAEAGRTHASTLVELIAETDEDLMLRYLEDDEFTDRRAEGRVCAGHAARRAGAGPLRQCPEEQGRAADAGRGHRLPAVAAGRAAGHGHQPEDR